MSYFSKLQSKINQYKARYPNNHKKIARKLIWWNLMQLFRTEKKSIVSCEPIIIEDNHKNLNNKIALYLFGGLGDILIGFNYACHLSEYLEEHNIGIDIYVGNGEQIKQLDGNGFFGIYSRDEDFNETYLLKINLSRMPHIVENNIMSSDYFNNKKILKLVETYNKFYQEYRKFFDFLPYFDGVINQYSIINGKTRIQQPDVGDILNIKENFKYIPAISDEESILDKFSLKEVNYITINRGVDRAGDVIESTKLWSLSKYNELTKLIKDNFKNYKIIQLGSSLKRCEVIDNIDINLVGKTNLNELKVLLKNSKLHIDSEGGMVHLRQSLKAGTSVVVFGPTSAETYGYSNNINISSKACANNCEWVSDSWSSCCINKKKPHICMKNIQASTVFEEVNRILNKKGIQ